MYGWMSEALFDWLPETIPAKHIATQPLFLCTCSNMTVLLGPGPDQTLRDLDTPSIPYPHVSYIMLHPYTGQPCLVSHRRCFLTSAFFSLGFPCFCPPYPPFLATPSSTPGCLPVDGPSAVPPNGPRAAARCLTRTHTLSIRPSHPIPSHAQTCAHTLAQTRTIHRRTRHAHTSTPPRRATLSL